MAYRTSGVTMIDDLPDIDQLGAAENGPTFPGGPNYGDYGPPDDSKYRKFIRGNHQMASQSGMGGGMAGYASQGAGNYGMLPPPSPPMMEGPPPPMPSEPAYMGINCIDINRHIQQCPICSRFYNNDKTVYVIAIVVLSIICLLLLKRVLNV